ncbi:MAG: hypothetical protein PHT33_10175, partial [bacterium]|nr:hypothetical protein [bacterium]
MNEKQRDNIMKSGLHKLLLQLVLFIVIHSGIAVAGGYIAGKNVSAIPTIALLPGSECGLNKAPLFSLLEADLLQDKKLKLLERNQIDQVFKEQELSLMLSPEGGASRVKAGRLLKADLLVLLQMTEKEVEDENKAKRRVRTIEVVISETGGGLRLMIRTLPAGDVIEADASALETAIREGIKKYKERIVEICAVPPFMSKDLSHQYDYLQTAYAKLVEQSLLRQSGIVVVELAEARAIAEEMSLTGDTAGIKRNLPLYIMGEYRNDGIEDKRQTRIALTLKRGDKELKGINSQMMTPEETAGYISDQITKLIRTTSGV